MTEKIYAGIDFGTSNSAIGITSPDDISLVELEAGKKVIPTTVFFRKGNPNDIAFGNIAINEYLSGKCGRFMRGLKSLLGSPIMDEGTYVGHEYTTFKAILSRFIEYLKIRAEKQAKQEITDIIVGRPVHFSNIEKEDKEAQTTLYDICKKLGFKNIGFQYEPIAAALDYEKQIEREQLVLVADIGGGTSDFSVIKLSPKIKLDADRTHDILSNDSVHIAGTDLDYRLSFMKIMPSFGKNTNSKDGLPMPMTYFSELSRWDRVVRLYNPETILEIKDLERRAEHPELLHRYVKVLEDQTAHHISFASEQAKIDLSETNWTEIDLYETLDGLEILLTKEEFEKTVKDETSQICQKAKDTIEQAGIRPSQVQTLLFTGGTSEVPAIKQGIQKICPHAQIRKVDNFAAVARGLTIDAKRHFSGKQRD